MIIPLWEMKTVIITSHTAGDSPQSHERMVDLTADVSLFTIPDHFVIGYGLDCAEHYRNLPYIAEYGE